MGALRPRLVPLEAALYAAVVAAVLAFAAAETLLAYRTSAAMAAALPIGGAAAAVVFLRPIWGVYLGILAVPLQVLNLSFGGFGLTPAEAILLVAAAGAVTSYVAGGRVGRPHLAHLAFGGILLLTLAGLTVATDSFVVMKILTMWTVFLVLSMLVASSDLDTVRRVLVCLGVSAGLLGLEAIAAGGNQQLLQGGEVVAGRAQGSFTHPNQLAFFLVLAIPPTLVLANQGRWRVRLPMMAAAAASLAGLFLTLTRGAIIGIVVALLVMLFWAPFRRLAIALLVVTMLYGFLNAGAISRSQEVSIVRTRLGTLTSREGRANPRITIWKTTPKIIAAHPFLGVGEGNYYVASLAYGLTEFGQPYEHAHNVLLTFAAELGLGGLALLLWFFFEVGRAGVRAMRDRRSTTFPLALGVTAGLTGLFVNGLTDYPPGENLVMATILINVGVLIALERLRASASAR